jgi:sialic acid synthase SpsE
MFFLPSHSAPAISERRFTQTRKKYGPAKSFTFGPHSNKFLCNASNQAKSLFASHAKWNVHGNK